MGHTTVRSFAVFSAMLNDATNVSKQALEAGNKNRKNAINNLVKHVEPMSLLGDELRQGLAGHNVLYVLGFSRLGAVIGLAVVALVVSHGSSAMLPA